MSNIVTKTKVLKVDPVSPDEKIIRYAAGIISGGGLVAFPTETVYGIGADFFNKEAVKKLYQIKRRPLNKPFTAHISSVTAIKKMRCEITNFAEALIKKFWPGPLTLILKSTHPTTHSTDAVEKGTLFHCVSGMGSGMGKIGFRMPGNTVARALIAASGGVVAAPSANFSGEKPPVEAGVISEGITEGLNLILDGGKTRIGIESTIVDMTVSPYRILRHGAIARHSIERVTRGG